MHNAQSTLNLVRNFNGETSLREWCAAVRYRYPQLEDTLDLVTRCASGEDRDRLVQEATAVRNSVHRALNKRCR